MEGQIYLLLKASVRALHLKKSSGDEFPKSILFINKLVLEYKSKGLSLDSALYSSLFNTSGLDVFQPFKEMQLSIDTQKMGFQHSF